MSSMRMALVISGGGSKGAFAVGALKYLMGTVGLNFDVFAGTSTGALIAPLLAARGSAALPELEQEYTTVRTPDILRERQPPERALVSSSVYTTEPLALRIGRRITPEVFATLAGSPRQLFITTVNLRTGGLVYFQTGPAVPRVTDADVVSVRDRDTLMRAILASASIPVLMNPVPISVGGGPSDPHADGGVREYAPVQVAIDAGATDIVCIALAPRERGPARERLDRLTGVAQRTVDVLTEEVGENDLRLAQIYTQGNWYLHAVRERQPPERALVSSSIYTTEPLALRIGRRITPQVFATLAGSPRQLFVTTVNLRTGRLVYFQTGPAVARVTDADVVSVRDRDTLMRAILASASIPVLMNPVPISVGGGPSDPH
ncbi:MAG TPA: patatin-like phospholipase family protein, partial [Longimicrobiaceae bacterium]|nr:patatin-like phospholipase family protein [Longimicrobiaceae bacterium]